MYSLCAVWYYGCHGWLTARTWVFRDADDRISDWCVRTPTVVDIYIFQNGAVPHCYIIVPYIYMELDYYVLSTCYMLDNCPPKARQTMEQLILDSNINKFC